jgi:predicted Zn-dependent protease
MKTRTLLTVSSAMALSLLASIGLFVSSSFAQENMTTATNETGGMMGNQTNQTRGNETQQGGPLEQLGKIFGGGK